MPPRTIDVDPREYPLKAFDRVVIPVFDHGSFGNTYMMVWAVEPVTKHKLRAFIRPLKKGEEK
jgi:hypothetical protein